MADMRTNHGRKLRDDMGDTANTSTDTNTGTVKHLPLSQPRLPSWAGWLVAALAVAAAGIVTLALGWNLVGGAVLAVVLFAAALPIWSRFVESSRAAKDRLVTTLVWSAFAIAMVPLVSLMFTVLKNGLGVINAQFLTYSMRNVIGEGGGIYHAILGTLLITLAAAVISVPIGLLTSIYLVEYAGKGKIGRTITFLVDVMTGIPSIVAGLFAYALFVLFFGEGVRMGFGGAVALSLLMIPIVVRSCEEMLKLVPHELREASYALGVPKWRTIVKVVHADRSARHHHRDHARGRPRHRRDRTAADHRRVDGLGEHSTCSPSG